jgi:hypothetical protein
MAFDSVELLYLLFGEQFWDKVVDFFTDAPASF